MVTEKELIEWAQKNKFYIHPKRLEEIDHFVDLINTKYNGGCMCDPKRPKCPCPQSVEEVRDSEGRGTCKCTLFVSETYLEKWDY